MAEIASQAIGEGYVIVGDKQGVKCGEAVC
jgi:hypothetical protein